MWQVIRRNPMAVFMAILLHIALAAFLIFGVDWKEKPKMAALPKADVVQAKVIDARQVDEEVEKLKLAETVKKARAEAEKKRLEEIKQKAEMEKKRLAELEHKRQEAERERKRAEKKRQAEIKRKAEAEKRRLAKLKKEREALEKQRKAEEQRLAALEKKRKAEEKKRKEEAAKKKAEKEKRKALEAKKKAEEKKRKAAEAKRKAEEKRRKAAEAKALAAKKKREAELQAQAQKEQDAREIDGYNRAIKRSIEGVWVYPSGSGEGLACTLRIRLGAGGAVLDAQVVKSSGNSAFDRSAVAAVYKADPLPVPDGRLFEEFRDFQLVFAPKG